MDPSRQFAVQVLDNSVSAVPLAAEGEVDGFGALGIGIGVNAHGSAYLISSLFSTELAVGHLPRMRLAVRPLDGHSQDVKTSFFVGLLLLLPFLNAAGAMPARPVSGLIGPKIPGSGPLLFRTEFPDDHVTTTTISFKIEVLRGKPDSVAVVVNSDDTSQARWMPFRTMLEVPLPRQQGPNHVWVGLKQGELQFWDRTTIWRDNTPPLLIVTNPVTSITSRPVIQLQGYSTERLLKLSYDIANASRTNREEQAFVSSQYFDLAQGRFTTNWFQGYDIRLARGTNVITLHATDLAGNVASSNYFFTLDYSTDTNPPVVTVYWPENGTMVSGDSFTLRGKMDDPTAVVWAIIRDEAGNRTEVEGLVERDGLVWVEGLPVGKGTNWLVLECIDEPGNKSSTNLIVLSSDVQVSMDPVPSEVLNKRFAPVVTGRISVPGYTVWVNGVRSTNHGDGTWTAYRVPIPEGGTALFQARAIPNWDNNGNGTPARP